MKIFIHNRYYRQLIEMPKHVQRAAMDSIDLFRKDRFANGLNYEKINNTKDKGMRSLRATGKFRIIIHEGKSNNYNILWVDSHDNAYTWAMKKMFQWNTLTQSHQLYDYSIHEIKEEVVIKKKTSFMQQFTEEQLLKIGVPEPFLTKVKAINDLVDLELLQSQLPEEVFEHLFYLLDGIDIREIILEIEEGLAKEGEDILQSANNRRNLLYISEDEDLKKHLEGDFELWKVFLHPSQRKLVEQASKGPVKVTGGAGTGKTVVAIHRIKWLLDNFVFQKAKPIFFTTFTKTLTAHLLQNLNTLGINTDRVEVTSLDKYVVQTIKKLELVPSNIKIIDYQKDKHLDTWIEVIENNPTTYSPEFLKTEYQDVILYYHIKDVKSYQRIARIGRPIRLGRKQRKDVWALFEFYKKLKIKGNYYEVGELYNILFDYYNTLTIRPYDHVICDEVQDFSNIQLRLLRSMASEKANDLFLVGDPFQSIYSRKINFSKANINIRGRRSKRLKVNYRTTEEIKKRAVALIKDVDYESFDMGEHEKINGYVSLMKGQAPTYECFATNDKFFKALVKKIEYYIEETTLSYSDICIAARVKNGMNAVSSFIHANNIPYFSAIKNEKAAYGNKDGIHLSTFHKLKGLEFKVVFLIGLDEQNFPFKPKQFNNWDEYDREEYLKSEKSLMYVAMSRAIQSLHLMGVGEKSNEL